MHCAAWDLQVLGSERIEAKTRHDDACEGGESGVRDLCSDSHDEQNPGFRVFGGLDRLVALEMVVLDALFVCGDARDGDEAFVFGQEGGGGGEVREDEEGDDAPGYGDGAEDQEDVHPLRKSGGDVSDCVADEAAEHGCDAVGAAVSISQHWVVLHSG